MNSERLNFKDHVVGRIGDAEEDWRELAYFEELSADCFNRPLLSALCERFELSARKNGHTRLAGYALAKLALQRAVISGTPTIESARLYADLKKDARASGDTLFESIVTAKLAAAVSQAYVAGGNRLYSPGVRGQLETLLGTKIPGLAALSHLKVSMFAEAVCLAVVGKSGSIDEAVSHVHAASSEAVSPALDAEEIMPPEIRAILGAAVGIANEEKEDLDRGHALFDAVLRIHPGFLAARLSAFHNRLAACTAAPVPDATLVDAMMRHLRACIDSIPLSDADALVFSAIELQLIQEMDVPSLLLFTRQRKSAPILAYAEFALEQVERYAKQQQDALCLATTCAEFTFPEVRVNDTEAYSFCCAVENSWRAELVNLGQTGSVLI